MNLDLSRSEEVLESVCGTKLVSSRVGGQSLDQSLREVCDSQVCSMQRARDSQACGVPTLEDIYPDAEERNGAQPPPSHPPRRPPKVVDLVNSLRLSTG